MIYNLGRVTNGFIILGYYNDLAALQAAIVSPSIGDAYGVGLEPPYDVYIYGEKGWFNNGPLGLKGDKGDTGAASTIPGPAGKDGDNGTSCYVWIKWSAAQPDSDDDISNTPNEYMGIYSGTSSTAPTNWSLYSWYKVKGADADIAALEDYIDNYIDEVILGGAS